MASGTATVQPTGPVTDVDEEFLALVYGDDDLLAAEFAAIIEASWSSTRPPLQARRQPWRPRHEPRRRATQAPRAPAKSRSATRPSVRERSPP
jgi:hypothetical protein